MTLTSSRNMIVFFLFCYFASSAFIVIGNTRPKVFSRENQLVSVQRANQVAAFKHREAFRRQGKVYTIYNRNGSLPRRRRGLKRIGMHQRTFRHMSSQRANQIAPSKILKLVARRVYKRSQSVCMQWPEISQHTILVLVLRTGLVRRRIRDAADFRLNHYK